MIIAHSCQGNTILRGWGHPCIPQRLFSPQTICWMLMPMPARVLMTYSFDVLIILFSFLPTINLDTILFSIAFSSGRFTMGASCVTKWAYSLVCFMKFSTSTMQMDIKAHMDGDVPTDISFLCLLVSFFNFPVPVAASFTIIFWWSTRNVRGIN